MFISNFLLYFPNKIFFSSLFLLFEGKSKKKFKEKMQFRSLFEQRNSLNPLQNATFNAIFMRWRITLRETLCAQHRRVMKPSFQISYATSPPHTRGENRKYSLLLFLCTTSLSILMLPQMSCKMSSSD